MQSYLNYAHENQTKKTNYLFQQKVQEVAGTKHRNIGSFLAEKMGGNIARI